MSNKDKLNSSKASSETVSSTSLNESEDSLEHLTNNQGSEDQSLDSTPQNTDGAPPIKTYVNLAETTQERIRRFEQETKAMLQREINRGQRRREYFGLDEPVTQPNEALMLAKDYSPGKCFLVIFDNHFVNFIIFYHKSWSKYPKEQLMGLLNNQMTQT